MQPPVPRVALREATREVHERLHNVPSFAALAAGTLGRGGYVRLLGRLFGFHEPMEAALADALPGRFAPESWQRTHLLRADLASFGLDEAALDRLPRAAPPVRLTEAEAMGCLYVLEGSTLGGRQLARQLDTLLAPGNPAGRRFLQGASQPAHLPWRSLCAELDRMGATPDGFAAMLGGALSTFARYERWFAES